MDLKFSSGLGLGRAGLGLGLVVCGLDYNTVVKLLTALAKNISLIFMIGILITGCMACGGGRVFKVFERSLNCEKKAKKVFKGL